MKSPHKINTLVGHSRRTEPLSVLSPVRSVGPAGNGYTRRHDHTYSYEGRDVPIPLCEGQILASDRAGPTRSQTIWRGPAPACRLSRARRGLRGSCREPRVATTAVGDPKAIVGTGALILLPRHSAPQPARNQGLGDGGIEGAVPAGEGRANETPVGRGSSQGHW